MWPAVGEQVKVTCVSGDQYTGCLFQHDTRLGLAFIMSSVVPSDYKSLPTPLRPAVQHRVQVIQTTQVASVVHLADQEKSDLPVVRPIKVERLLKKEHRALAKRQSEVGQQAPNGATEEAMSLFSALSKT